MRAGVVGKRAMILSISFFSSGLRLSLSFDYMRDLNNQLLFDFGFKLGVINLSLSNTLIYMINQSCKIVMREKDKVLSSLEDNTSIWYVMNIWMKSMSCEVDEAGVVFDIEGRGDLEFFEFLGVVFFHEHQVVRTGSFASKLL